MTISGIEILSVQAQYSTEGSAVKESLVNTINELQPEAQEPESFETLNDAERKPGGGQPGDAQPEGPQPGGVQPDEIDDDSIFSNIGVAVNDSFNDSQPDDAPQDSQIQKEAKKSP